MHSVFHPRLAIATIEGEIKCLHCIYWYPERKHNLDELTEGQCRFNAPQFRPNAEQKVGARGAWPLTFGQDWCGQFHPAQTGQEGAEGHIYELAQK